jgi:signal transduction histidine kinase
MTVSNPKTTLGLLNVRERANYMGIDLKIDSAPEYGNRITLAIPHNLVQDTVPRVSPFEEHPKSVLSDMTEKKLISETFA